MPTMTAAPEAPGKPALDIDQLCDSLTEDQLKLVASKSLQKLVEKFDAKVPYVVCDEKRKPIACFAPVGMNSKGDASRMDDAEFIRIAEERIADPTEEMLTVDEFLAAIPRRA